MIHVFDCPWREGYRIRVNLESRKLIKTFERLVDEIDPPVSVAADF